MFQGENTNFFQELQAVKALVLSPEDNVATALDEIRAGDTVSVIDTDRNVVVNITVSEGIIRGHKIALRDIACGSDVIKYGQIIGIAVKDIAYGDYVHTHNLASKRGRGDLT